MLSGKNLLYGSLLLFVLFTFGLTGCGNNSESGTWCRRCGFSPFIPCCGNSSESGTLKIRLTDSPYPFDLIKEARVTITGVKVHVSESPEVSSGFIDLPFDAPQTFDLMDLQGGVTAMLVNASLPVGTYKQMRLVVDSGYILLNDDRSFELKVPSGSESGIKIFPDPPIEVRGGLTTDLILDFDVSRSFLPIPSSANKVEEIERFTFHPVIRVVNNSSAGSISGTVYNNNSTPDDLMDDTTIEGAALTAFEGTMEVTSTASQSDGSYVLMGLMEGTYDIRVTHPDFQESTKTDISVFVGNDTGGTDFRISPVE